MYNYQKALLYLRSNSYKWLLGQVRFSLKFKPIPDECLFFHEILSNMNIYNKLSHKSLKYNSGYTGYTKCFFYEHFLPDIVFYVLCKNDDFIYAKELYEFHIVNNRCLNNALRMATFNGNFEMVMWVYGLIEDEYRYIEVSYRLLDDCLKICVYLEKFEIMKWLLTKIPEKYRSKLLSQKLIQSCMQKM